MGQQREESYFQNLSRVWDHKDANPRESGKKYPTFFSFPAFQTLVSVYHHQDLHEATGKGSLRTVIIQGHHKGSVPFGTEEQWRKEWGRGDLRLHRQMILLVVGRSNVL